MGGDAVHHRIQVQRRGQVPADVGQRRRFARATLGFLQQARVLERHAHARRRRWTSRRTSASSYAASRSWFSSAMKPNRRSPAKIGTRNAGTAHVGARRDEQFPGRVVVAALPDDRLTRLHGLNQRRPVATSRARTAAVAGARRARRRTELQLAGRLVDPGDAQVAGAEQRAQLVAHQVDDGLVVQLRGNALLHAVDQRQLGSAPGHLAFKAINEARIGQRHGSLRGQHGKQVAVGVVEAPARTFDVGVEKAQQLIARHQRGDQAAALVELGRTVRPMAQPDCARAARLVEPRRDRTQQRPDRLLPWATARRRHARRLVRRAAAACARRR